MNETDMLRVSKELKTKLKHKAKVEGRTLEWMANDALNEYLAKTRWRPATPADNVGVKRDAGGYKVFGAPMVPDEPTTEATDDWGA